MRTMYKDGMECIADNSQVDAMTEAGWSLEKEEVVQEKQPISTGETKIPLVKRKIAKEGE